MLFKKNTILPLTGKKDIEVSHFLNRFKTIKKISKFQYLYNLNPRLNKLYSASRIKCKKWFRKEYLFNHIYTWTITYAYKYILTHTFQENIHLKGKKSRPQNLNVEVTQAENLHKRKQKWITKIGSGWLCHLSISVPSERFALSMKASPKFI